MDRGAFHTGLRAVANQEQRGKAYIHYLSEALKHPNIVGTHWFQYRQQHVTGRNNSGQTNQENFQIGLVDITDNPRIETVEAARLIGDNMYEFRYYTEPSL